MPDQPFTEPWQARVFASAIVVTERMGLPWDAFRDQLKAAVAADPERPYFESFTEALERLVATRSSARAPCQGRRPVTRWRSRGNRGRRPVELDRLRWAVRWLAWTPSTAATMAAAYAGPLRMKASWSASSSMTWACSAAASARCRPGVDDAVRSGHDHCGGYGQVAGEGPCVEAPQRPARLEGDRTGAPLGLAHQVRTPTGGERVRSRSLVDQAAERPANPHPSAAPRRARRDQAISFGRLGRR